MAVYEFICILKPTVKVRKKLIEKIEAWFKKSDVKIKDKKEWGKKELAYPIQKHSHGFYYFWQLSAEPKKIIELDPKIKLEEKIIRHLLVRNQN